MKIIETGIKLKLAKSPSKLLRIISNDRILLALIFLVMSIRTFLDEEYIYTSLILVVVFLNSLSAYESHRASKISEKRKHVIIQFKEDADREKVFNAGTSIVEEMLSRDVIESATFDMKDKTR